jgi:site-specific recombinase XerD
MQRFCPDRGVEGRAIQTQLGHKSYSSTQVYLHMSANRQREGIQEAWASAEAFSSREWGDFE